MCADPKPPSAAYARRAKWMTAFSCAASGARNVIDDAAARRPFLDAGEMIVLAVMPRPHWMNQRTIRRLVIVEAARQAGEALQRAVSVKVGRAVLELDRFVAARRLAAFEHHIDDLGDRRVRQAEYRSRRVSPPRAPRCPRAARAPSARTSARCGQSAATRRRVLRDSLRVRRNVFCRAK